MLKTNFEQQYAGLARVLRDQFPKILIKAENDALRRVASRMNVIGGDLMIKRSTIKAQAGKGRKMGVRQFRDEFNKKGTVLKGFKKSYAYLQVSGKAVAATRYKTSPNKIPKQKGKKGGSNFQYASRQRITIKPFTSGGATYKESFLFRDSSGRMHAGYRRFPSQRKKRQDKQMTHSRVRKVFLPGPGALMFKDAHVTKSILAAGRAKFRERFPKQIQFFGEQEIKRRLRANIKRTFK